MIRCLLLLILPCLTQQSGDLSPLIRPSKYNLLFDTNFQTWAYKGFVNITFDVLGKVDEIKLHATEKVKIDVINVYSIDSKLLRKLTVGQRQNAAKDLLVFKLSEPLKQGEYIIKSTFSGLVSSKLTGYYRTGYKMIQDGRVIRMASTHLSPDKSRTVFPSFDEPQFRAKFSLSLIHPDSLTATSNMPVIQQESLDKNQKLTVFDVTPPMATYLLAWVQHNFIYSEQTIAGVRMRHYARPGYPDVIDEKIKLVGEALKYFNNYFNIPYPLPKLDTIGIPNYLVGGMENWGLITLSEGTGLSTPEKRFGSREVSYRNLIAHEVSHMWFGNLVTMYWWNDLWLKEGMSSYLSYPCVGAIYSDVDMEDQLMTDNWMEGMLADKVITSHPVQMPIKVTSQITQIFDKITYSKGAAVLTMLRDVMGEEEFKAGMTHFLDKYRYSVARYDDLMTSMTQFCAEGPVVRRFMDTFILQKNYPLVKVEILGDRKIRLVQSRYVRDSGMILEDDSSPYNYSWLIPITVLSDSFALTKHIMMKGESMEVTLPETFKWLKLNIGGKMMYVTSYPPDSINKLLEAVRDNAKDPDLRSMSHRDRGHVLCDIFNAAQLNLLPYSTAFHAAKYLRYEKHYLPWTLTYQYLRQIRTMIDENLANCYRKYIIYLLQPQWKSIVAKRQETLEDQLKFEVFFKFAKFIRGARLETVHQEEGLRSAIASYKVASKEERAELSLQFDTTSSDQVIRIGNTLAKYPSTDVSVIIDFITHYSDKSPEAVWRVYRDNYDVYNDKYGLAQFTYADALKTMIKNQRDKDVIMEIEAFFKENTAGAGYLGVQNGLEEAKYTAKFKEAAEPELKLYLENHAFCENLV